METAHLVEWRAVFQLRFLGGAAGGPGAAPWSKGAARDLGVRGVRSGDGREHRGLVVKAGNGRQETGGVGGLRPQVADAIVINKCDTIDASQRDRLQAAGLAAIGLAAAVDDLADDSAAPFVNDPCKLGETGDHSVGINTDLAQGLLTDRYIKGVPSGSRIAKTSSPFLTTNDLTNEVLVKIKKIGKHIQEKFAHKYYDEISC